MKHFLVLHASLFTHARPAHGLAFPTLGQALGWIEIRDKNGRVVTVIELLSPSNKDGEIDEYRERRSSYFHGGANIVEIDLLRGGRHVLAVQLEFVRVTTLGKHYLVCVTRAKRVASREVYAMPLREPLSKIRIPLRPEDSDVVLDLQPLVDCCYRMGSYWNADQQNVPGAALDDDEAAWVADQVKAAGLLE